MAAAAGAGAAAAAAAGQEEAMSSATKQKVAAAKQYIENHYKTQMKSLQERKERSVSALSVLVPPFPLRWLVPRVVSWLHCRGNVLISFARLLSF
jgi:hypothetical protein